MDIRLVSGAGSLDQVGTLADSLALTRVLIVADKGIVAAGFAARAASRLRENGIAAWTFDRFGPNPDTRMLEAGCVYAAEHRIDGLVALGGGSSLDCAKGINGLLKATHAMLPAIGIPTTAGTGSEAQALAFRIVILDAELTVSQPREVTAAAGYDALSHAVEAFVSKTRTPESQELALQAWRLLEGNYERVLAAPTDLAAREAMLYGANRAGAAIERSGLGAADACASPLTAKYGTTHGAAIAVMLPHVVRWNAEAVADEYARLWTGDLAHRLDQLALAGGLPRTLRELGVLPDDLDALAAGAATQWTGQHNPRAFSADEARALYQRAL